MSRTTMTFGGIIGPTNPIWTSNPDYNKVFVQAQESYLNDLLMQRPFLTVNDVFEAFGLDRSVSGMVFGWTWGEDGGIRLDLHPEDDGSFRVSFTATNIYEEMSR